MEQENNQCSDNEIREYLLKGVRKFALVQKRQMKTRKQILDAADPSMESRQNNQESYLASMENYVGYFQWRIRTIREQYNQN